MALILTLIVFFGYFLRASALPLRGEEPRRAQIAVEMIESSDWIVPREQGDPFLSRPPLQNWLIGLCFLAGGERDAFTVRLHALVSTWLMVLIVYGYGRTFLSRTGALAAGAAFATFGEVMQECSTAETEALFTLLVSGSLLLWHWGMVRGWPAVLAWSLGYALMALGMLAKSLQAPVYFLAPVFVYLVLTRQWRQLFSLAHLAGILVGAGVLAAWVVPFHGQLGLDGVRSIWMNDVRTRIFEWQGFLIHFARFPAELFGCLMPWTPLLFAYVWRPFRSTMTPANGGQLMFAAIVLAIGVPTVWWPPNGMTRYLLPLYPSAAVLVGYVVQRCAEAAADSPVGVRWRRCLVGYCVLITGVGLAVPAAGFIHGNRFIEAFAEPPLLAGMLCLACFGLAWLVRKSSLSAAPSWRGGVAATSLAAFMVLLFAGPVLDVRIRIGNDIGAEIARLKADLPAGASIVSINHTCADLPFHLGEPIKAIAWSGSQPLPVPEGAYFTFTATGAGRPTLPFAWEEVRAISVDRRRSDHPENVVVIARRLPAGTKEPSQQVHFKLTSRESSPSP